LAKLNNVGANCWHVGALLGMFMRLSFRNFQSWNSAALSEREQKNAHRLRKLRLEADRATQIGLAHHHAGELRLCSSFRHDSLNSRNGSIAGEFNIPRNSGSVLFGAKYVSTIILTTLSAFSMVWRLDRMRIRLVKAYTFTKSDFNLVVRKRICVQPGCLFDKFFVELLSSALFLGQPFGGRLVALREPSSGKRGDTSDHRSR
jgi:hypothetical protein